MSGRLIAACWIGIAAILTVLTGVLLAFGDHFDWARELTDIPSIQLAAGGVIAGGIFSALVPLIPQTLRQNRSRHLLALGLVIVIGIGLRLALLWSTPALEDDFYRYLWDGGVSATALNPYALAPDAIYADTTPDKLQELGSSAGAVLERINHPHLKTIYPPVAQFWFALAHTIEPWSLLAWRALILGCELVSLVLILDLLRLTGRSLLWSALYWWNPVAIKELMNSAHMEAVLLPVLLLSIWLAVRQRYMLGAIALAFAVGTKLWPVMLYPLFLRPLMRRPALLMMTVLMVAGFIGLWALPPYLGGLDETSGFVAFAKKWQTNSALFQNLRAISETLFVPALASTEIIGIGLRLCLAAAVGLIALAVSRAKYDDPHDFVVRAAWIVGAQFFLSPVQFPWYATWVFVLLPFVPITGLIAVAVMIPLYYLSFYFAGLGRYDLFNAHVLWVIWVPIWVLLARDAWRAWRQPLNWKADA